MPPLLLGAVQLTRAWPEAGLRRHAGRRGRRSRTGRRDRARGVRDRARPVRVGGLHLERVGRALPAGR